MGAAHVLNDFGVLKERIPSVEGLNVSQNFEFGKGRKAIHPFIQRWVKNGYECPSN